MPIDPNIVGGLAPAQASPQGQGTYAQVQTMLETRRKAQEAQRKQRDIADILGSADDDDVKVNRLNQVDVEIGSKYRTQLDAHVKNVDDTFLNDLKKDDAEIKLLARTSQGISDQATLDVGRRLLSSYGPEGQKLATMLPEQWDDATSPAVIEKFVAHGMEAAQYVKSQQDAYDKVMSGDYDRGVAELLATADTPEDAQGVMAMLKARRAPKAILDRYAPMVAQWSPGMREAVADMALTEQQRRTLAGQAATRDDAAAQRDIANARADQQLAISQEHLNLSRQANARAAQGGGSSAEGGGGLTPDAVDYIATQYRILGPSGIPTRISEGERIRIANAAASQVKSLGQSPVAAVQKQAAYKSDSAALTQMTKMREAAGSFENKAVAQADIVGQLSDKVGRTSSPMLNSWWLAGKKEVAGDTDTALLYNAIQTFASEYAKIMEGSTGSVAASSDSARKASENLIKASMSPKTTRAAIDLMKREMGLTMQGYDATIAHITERMGGAPTGAASRETLGPNQRAIKGGGVAELRNGEWVRIR